jgi:tRNA threonylcarbamoyladenosine biosynthesis protein TsaB
MKILAIETSGKVGGVALCMGEETPGAPFVTLFERSFTEGLIHGRELAPAVKAALDETRLAPDGLDLVAVSHGPGSYTGLRVGIAFAKTFAWSVKRPLVGVGSLAAMAENAAGAATAVPVLDARWGQVYGAVYERRGGAAGQGGGLLSAVTAWREAVAPVAETAAAFAARIPAGAAVFGDALNRYRDALLRADVKEGDPSWAIPRAATVARLGLAAYHANRRDESATLLPLYLRPTEAEVNAGLKNKSDPSTVT